MKVTALFFSVLRDLSRSERLELDLPPGLSTLGDLVALLGEQLPTLAAWEGRLLLAVNGEYAELSTKLSEGDEVALMPPVQGG